jgi:hypothetical protein
MKVTCKQCARAFNKAPNQVKKTKNNFCSRSCSVSFNNALKSKRPAGPWSKKEKRCWSCKETYVSKDTNSKYCCRECQHDWEYTEAYDKWLANKPTYISPNVLKRFLTDRDTYKCSNCSITEWDDKPIVLELEHKDGNSENNTQANLCLLCPNCHSQTDTYKAKNTGNGRHKRRQRYAEGKSY